MPIWTDSMQQTYEFYEVDPATWSDKRKLEYVTSGDVTHDLDTDTISTASIETTEELGEMYIRPYLITIQNGVRDRIPMGSYLSQTPGFSFNGRIKNNSLEAYSPLLELKESSPPIGYTILKNSQILRYASRLTAENVRAPVVESSSTETIPSDFVSDPTENWLTYLGDLLGSINYRFDLDEMGRILFSRNQNVSSMQPVWAYNDDNSSILYPEINMSRDLYGIPNVVEVVYSKDLENLYAVAKNEDPGSPTSIPSRGREIVHRITDPDLPAEPSVAYLQQYAKQQLKALSSLEYTVTYTHGYCPVRVGDCVRLNYERAGFNNVKAKVIRQHIKLEPGTPVEETAVYTENLWGN